MKISSSYSLFFHPQLPSLRNSKPALSFYLQPEENVSFPLGNQVGLGEKTDGDTAHFTLRQAQQLYLESV